jgi:hypothetical protein
MPAVNLLERPIRSIEEVKAVAQALGGALQELHVSVPNTKLLEAVSQLCGVRHYQELRARLDAAPSPTRQRKIELLTGGTRDGQEYGPQGGKIGYLPNGDQVEWVPAQRRAQRPKPVLRRRAAASIASAARSAHSIIQSDYFRKLTLTEHEQRQLGYEVGRLSACAWVLGSEPEWWPVELPLNIRTLPAIEAVLGEAQLTLSPGPTAVTRTLARSDEVLREAYTRYRSLVERHNWAHELRTLEKKKKLSLGELELVAERRRRVAEIDAPYEKSDALIAPAMQARGLVNGRFATLAWIGGAEWPNALVFSKIETVDFLAALSTVKP